MHRFAVSRLTFVRQVLILLGKSVWATIFCNKCSESECGGGVYMESSMAHLSNNTFNSNAVRGDGGGVFMMNSTVSFYSEIFR